jgi:hypothetical protein
MIKQASELTALSHHVDGVGKLFSDSKTRNTWTFDINGETQVIVVTVSWNSGKFVVELNGYERFHQITSSPFVYSFKFRDRLFRLYTIGDRVCLDIDGVGFDTYTSRGKSLQAAMLAKYANSVTEDTQQDHEAVKQGYEPFTGQLSKRLGRGKQDEPAQFEIGKEEEEEDFFSRPVQVPSYVGETTDVSSLTVIPDLIEFSNPVTPNVRVPELIGTDHGEKGAGNLDDEIIAGRGIVTPREKISPDHLINPFAAFDELTTTTSQQEVESSPRRNNPFQIQ